MGQILEESLLTDGDRLYARLWCYTYKKESRAIARLHGVQGDLWHKL